MKKIILFLLLIYGYCSVIGQSIERKVHAASGEILSGNNTTLNFTMGEYTTGELTNGTYTITQGFQQVTINLNCDELPQNGSIIGCEQVCKEEVHLYEAYFDNADEIAQYKWFLSSTTDAFISSQDTLSTVEVTFATNNAINTTITLNVVASNDCGVDTVDFPIFIDKDGVWPGDVNQDGVVTQGRRVEWTNDVTAFSYGVGAFNKYMELNFSNPDIYQGSRNVPCNENLEKYNWTCHPSLDWSAAFDINQQDGANRHINAKHLDCDGDGEIENRTSIQYRVTGLPKTDADVIYHNLGKENSQQSNLKQNDEDDVHLIPMDKEVANGNEIRLLVTVGSQQKPVEEIHSLAFVAEFTLGTYRRPELFTSHSYLEEPLDIQAFHYPALNNESNLKQLGDKRTWHIGLGRFGTDGKGFVGQQVCKVECIAVIEHYPPASKTTDNDYGAFKEIEVSITEAGIMQEGGIYKDVQGGTTTVKVWKHAPIIADLKILLEGAYDSTIQKMRTALYNKRVLPMKQPFNVTPWCYDGTERIIIEDSLSKDIVDWVLLEFRDAQDKKKVIKRQAVLLASDGSIVGMNDTVKVFGIDPTIGYHVAIRHRNHTDIITSTPIQVIDNQLTYDFSQNDNAIHGEKQAKEIAPNVYALLAGDGNGDGLISTHDYNEYNTAQTDTDDYVATDFNLDGQVDENDNPLYQSNIGYTGSTARVTTAPVCEEDN